MPKLLNVTKMLHKAASSGIVDGDAALIIPGHPVPGIFENLGRMFLKGRQVIEGIDMLQIAGVDQAHEHVADEGAVLGLIKVSIFAIQNSLFQGPFHNVII